MSEFPPPGGVALRYTPAGTSERYPKRDDVSWLRPLHGLLSEPLTRANFIDDSLSWRT